MSPSFPKFLADFGRQFIWSPLSVNNKYRELNKLNETEVESGLNKSTFYCYGDISGSSVHCLSEDTEVSSESISTGSFGSSHYTNCDQNSEKIITNNSFDDKSCMKCHLIVGSTALRNGKCLSEPNLQIDTNSCFSDSSGYKIINDKKSDVSNDYLQSLTSTKLKSDGISNTNNISLDEEIPFLPTTNPYNHLLEEIDRFSSDKTNTSAISHDYRGSEEAEFVTKINEIIATEMCQNNNCLTHLKDDKQISCSSDENYRSSSLLDSRPSHDIPEKMNNHFVKCNQIVEKEENTAKRSKEIQNTIKREMENNSKSKSNCVENVILNDYFDNRLNSSQLNDRLALEHRKLVNRHSLPTDPAMKSISDEKRAAICFQNRNSRRLIVSDKRLKNSVLDKIKRIGRSQSQGRSDLSSMSLNSSRQFVFRTKDLYMNMKRRFSSVPPSPSFTEVPQTVYSVSLSSPNKTSVEHQSYPANAHKINETDSQLVNEDNLTDFSVTHITPTVVLRRSSSYESIEDSGCGSSIQTSSLSTDSNRSSICTGDDFYSTALKGPFIGYAKAITDCTPCPYYKNALTFKRGDIIAIISKDESGTWVGMNNGRIGHFKFVNVNEIKHSEQKRCKSSNLNQTAPQLQDYYQNSDFDDPECKKMIDILKSRLIACNQSQTDMTFNDLKQLIGLTEVDSNLLSIFGYNDLKLFSQIINKDRLNELGITDCVVQQTILLASRLLRRYYFCNHIETNEDHISQLPHKYWIKHAELHCSSAPTTPSTPINFTTEHLTRLMSKLESVSTSSLNNYSSEECTPELDSKIDANNSQQTLRRTTNENSEQLIDSVHGLPQNSNCRALPISKSSNEGFEAHRSEQTSKNDLTSYLKNKKCSQNNVRFETIRDKSLDRNLLRKLDLKPIYMSSESKECSSKPGVTSRGKVISQSVIDLRTNTLSKDSMKTCNIKTELPLDTLRSKRRLKKLMSSSKKFSSFQSHNSLIRLANSTVTSTTTTAATITNTSTISTGLDNDTDITKLCSNKLKDAIDYKLKSENIDLKEQPYSDPAGFCGIPPALIQRYADECQRDTYEIAEALDALRMKALEKSGRRGVPNDYLGDSCVGPVIDVANYESLHLWLISLGLPMYENCLKANGLTNLYKMSKLREVDIVNKCGIRDRRHIRILTNAIGALHLSFGEIDNHFQKF